MGGLLLCKPPLFGQYTIDLTDGICSDRFLISVEEVARSYAEDLGTPEYLSNMIDSSFISEDYISTITYLYIANFSADMSKTYLADVASVMQAAGCYRLPDSLFKLHLDNNPHDSKAIGSYALLLANHWRFKEAGGLIERNLRKFRGEKRKALLNDLGLVKISEYLRNDNPKALRAAFEALRKARLGSSRSPTTLQKGIVDFKLDALEHNEAGKYRFNAAVEHAVGSDAIILGIEGKIFFGREMTTILPKNSVNDIEKLFGGIYLAPGDKLTSELGGFEVISDLGEFAPFYEGRIELEVDVVFPDGSRKVFKHAPERLIAHAPGLGYIMSELYSGNGEWSCSLLTEMDDSGATLPELWRESAYLSSALEDSTQWIDAIAYMDSLMEIKIRPNLWVYRGAVEYLLGNYTEARHPLAQALENDPNNYWAMHNLALVEYELGNLDSSIVLFVKTAEINPEMIADYILAGVILEEMGELEKALLYYRIGSANSAFRADEVSSWIKTIEEKLGVESLEY